MVTATSGWDRASGDYRILLSPARLAARLQEPRLSANSPLVRIRLRQEDARTVAVFLKPAAGVQIGAANSLPSRTVALQLQPTQTARVVPISPSLQPLPVSPPFNSTPSVNAPRLPNGRLVVVLDPGHGGPDPGAVGIGGLQEKGVVLDISRQVAALLEQQGIQAILTRPDDRDLGLAPRVQIAKQTNATLFVSIHANAISMSRPEVNGLETYYFSSGATLARTVHDRVLQETGIGDRKVRKARFYVLRYTAMPSILVEVGFLTGENDAPKLADPAYRSQTAAAIARGILQYLQFGT